MSPYRKGDPAWRHLEILAEHLGNLNVALTKETTGRVTAVEVTGKLGEALGLLPDSGITVHTAAGAVRVSLTRRR